METDGVLALARWLDCPLENFIASAEGVAQGSPRVAKFRFSCKTLYAALDAQRRARKMTWGEVGIEIGGFPAGMLTRLAGGGRISVQVMIPAVGWLGRTVESFTDPCETGKPDAR
jgi:hypothetical protein